MFATSSPAVLIFCSLWCLVLPCVAVPSLVSNQERYKAAKLPDYKDAEEINPHQYCLGQVEYAQHSWKLKNYRKRQFEVGQIRSAGTVFQSLLLLLLYGRLCVVCNVGAVVGLGVDCMTASEQFDQFGSAFFPVKRLVLLFVITCIVSLQLWTMRAFPTRSSGKATNQNCRKKCRQRAGILPFTNCFCTHELLLIMSGDVELNPGPAKIEPTATTTTGRLDTETPAQESTAPLFRSSENNAIETTETTETTADNLTSIPTVPESPPAANTGQDVSISKLTKSVESKTADDKKSTLVISRLSKVHLANHVAPERNFIPANFEEPKNEHLPTFKPFTHNSGVLKGDDSEESLTSEFISHETEALIPGRREESTVEGAGVEANGTDGKVDQHPQKHTKQKQSNEFDSETFFSNLRAANQQFKKKENYPLCIRCGRKKQTKGKKLVKISHIFPKSMLYLFLSIHCKLVDGYFIFPQKTGFFEQDIEYGYPLQCFNCEQDLQDKESNLKYVYLLLIAKNEEVRARVAKTVMKKTTLLIKDMWIPYVLVNIMYRGLLVSGSFNAILDDYLSKFIKLWENALGNGTTTDVRLYVIPLHSISTNDVHFMNVLERPLRNPTTTELHTHKDAGEFLYTHFDCFHLVLPLCTKSEEYFSSYTGVNITDKEVNLKRCQYETRVNRNQVTYHYPVDHSKCIPPILHTICFEKYRTSAQELMTTIETTNPPTLTLPQRTINLNNILGEVLVKREPPHSPTQKPPTPTNKYVLYMPEGSAAATSDDPEKYTLYTKEQVKQQESKLIVDAAELPFRNRLYQFVEDYKKLSLDLEEAKKYLEKVKEKAKKELEKVKEKAKKELEKANMKTDKLQQRIIKLEETIQKDASKIEEHMLAKKSVEKAYNLLDKKSTKQTQELEEENKQLKEENKQLKEEKKQLKEEKKQLEEAVTDKEDQLQVLEKENKQLREKLDEKR